MTFFTIFFLMKNEKKSDNSSVSSSITYRVAREVADVKFSIYGKCLSDLPALGRVFPCVPTVAFGLAENIEKGSTAWTTVTDVGIDVGINILLSKLSIPLKLSEFANAQRHDSEKYHDLFIETNLIHDSTLDVSDEFERRFEQNFIHGLAIFHRIVLKTKEIVAELPDMVFGTTAQEQTPPSLHESSANNFNSHCFFQGSLDQKQLQCGIQEAIAAVLNPQLQLSQPAMTLMNSNNPLAEPAIEPGEPTAPLPVTAPVPPDVTPEIPIENKPLPTLSPAAVPSSGQGIGVITPNVQLIPKGIHVGFSSTNNALNTDIDVGFRFVGLDDLISEALNRFLDGGYYLGEGRTTIHGEPHKYTFSSVGGHIYRITLCIKNEKTGQHSTQYINLHSFDLQNRRNTPLILKAFQRGSQRLMEKRFPHITNDSAQITAAINANQFVQARNLINAFESNYSVIPGMSEYVADIRTALNHRDANHLTQQGIQNAQQGNHETAIANFQQAQILIPQHPQATIELANLYLKENNLSAAIQQLEQIVPSHPNYQSDLNRLKSQIAAERHLAEGNRLIAEGQPEAAKIVYQQAQDCIVNHPASTIALANLCIQANDLAGAIQQLEKIAELDPTYKIRLDELRKYLQAEQHIKTGIKLNEEGKTEEAQCAYQTAQQLIPNHIEAAFRLAYLHAAQSDFQQAIKEIKKLDASPERDQFLSRLQATIVERRATPFLNVLSQLIDEHLQQNPLPSTFNTSLRVLSAVHHLHPQALIAIPHLLNPDPLVCSAWGCVLEERLANPFTVAFGVTSALQVLGLSQHLPFHRPLSELLSYSQYFMIGSQLSQDLGLLSSLSSAEKGLQLAIKTGSLSMATSLFVPPLLLSAYDSVQHDELAPETSWQCFMRDGTLIGTNIFTSLLLMPPPLAIWNVSANLTLPTIKSLIGSYHTQAKAGLLRNARYYLTKEPLETATQEGNQTASWEQQAEVRYQSLAGYEKEMRFKLELAASDGADLSHFQFSPEGGNGTVSVAIATHLLFKEIISDKYKAKSTKVKNHYLHTLARLTAITYQKEQGNAANAKQLYALEVATKGYANSAEAQLNEAVEDITIEYERRSSQNSFAAQLTDWMITVGKKMSWLSSAQTSTETIYTQLTELKKQFILSRENALRFSSGDRRAGFARYLDEHISSNNNTQPNELRCELKLIEVLDYLYADHPQNTSTDRPRDEKQMAAKLLFVIKNSKQINLLELAQLLLDTLKSSERPPLHKTYSSSSSLNDFLKENAHLFPLYSPITKPREKNHTAPVYSEIKLINCFYDLMYHGITVADSTILNAVMAEFTEPLSEPEARHAEEDPKHHFRYENELKPSSSNLVALYLSGMVMFAYLIKILIKTDPVDLQIKHLRHEILDGILLRGYLPPFSMLMVRLTNCYIITEEQSHEMLSWYGLDLNQHSARTKLEILLKLYRTPFIGKQNTITTLSVLCQTWGNIVRSALFPQTAEKTSSLCLLMNIRGIPEEELVKDAEELLKLGADPDCIIDTKTLLQVAVERELPKLVEVLCRYGVRIDDVNEYGISCLQLAAIKFVNNSKNEILKRIIIQLCQYGASLDEVNHLTMYSSPTWWWFHGNQSALNILESLLLSEKLSREQLISLEYNRLSFLMESPKSQTTTEEEFDELSPIHEAVRTGDLAATRQLLQQDASLLLTKTAYGLTPLHYACEYNQQEVIHYLLSFARAKKCAKLWVELLCTCDQWGFSALDYAWYKGHGDLYQMLIAYYEIILPEEMLLSWLHKHLLSAIERINVSSVVVLLVKIGLGEIDSKSFVTDFIQHLNSDDQRKIEQALLDAEKKRVISSEQTQQIQQIQIASKRNTDGVSAGDSPDSFFAEKIGKSSTTTPASSTVEAGIKF